ncbi:MAG TPA: hypothetical protein VE135_04110 [Pyrinomonadaceae bacterium]|nr:hypothetical protein [Pyrinomonadaceae bacterium]
MEPALAYEDFARNIKTTFNVSDAGGTELELIELSELKLSPGHEQFSLVFRGPSERFLGQGTRVLQHDAMGQFSLFIVPIRQDGEGYYYEAVFNRFRTEPMASTKHQV